MASLPAAKAKANGVLRNYDLRFAVRWPMIGMQIANDRNRQVSCHPEGMKRLPQEISNNGKHNVFFTDKSSRFTQ